MPDRDLCRELTEARREAENLRLSLAELQHRCRNEWQTLAALTENEAARCKDRFPRDSLTRLQAYARMVAETHCLLATGATGDGERVSLTALLDALGPLLRAKYCGVSFFFEIEAVPLSTRQHRALALICSELVCNATKHGAGRVAVVFDACGGEGRFRVSDDGPGFPAGFDLQKDARAGLEVVETLCRHDLNGATLYGNGGRGARVMVSFPLDPPDCAKRGGARNERGG